MVTAVQISAIAPTSAVGRADSMLPEIGDVKNPVVTEMWKDGRQHRSCAVSDNGRKTAISDLPQQLYPGPPRGVHWPRRLGCGWGSKRSGVYLLGGGQRAKIAR
jgi:hypothetical protein